jgi:hypothetical protein
MPRVPHFTANISWFASGPSTPGTTTSPGAMSGGPTFKAMNCPLPRRSSK